MSTSKSVRRSTVHFAQHVSGGSGSASATASPAQERDRESSTSSHASHRESGHSTPLSPTRLSRAEEKQQLQHLNDRLSCYIERVRNLENENQRLSYQVRTSEETIVKERSNMKSVYEAELHDARRLLDEMAKEKARLQIDCGKYRSEAEEAKDKLATLERDLKQCEKHRLNLDGQVQDLTGRLNTADGQRKHWEDEAKKLRMENDNLKKQLDTAHKQLEDETLLRVDLENRLQSIREELAFNKQMYEQEIDETRQRRQTEITEINTQLEDQYKTKLQEGLQEMRQQFEVQLRQNRKDIEDMYSRKMEDIRNAAERNSNMAISSREDMKKMRITIDTLEKEKGKFESTMSAMEKKIRDLEAELASERDSYYGRIQQRDAEIQRLNAEIAEMLQDYQDLMDTKIQLDVEIEAYRRLLESEEARLHLTPTPPPSGATTPKAVQRGAKRKRVLQEREVETFTKYTTHGEAIGDIEVVDHCTDGQYVKLHNKGDKDVSLGNWMLVRTAAGAEARYKFHRSLTLRAGKTCTIWSSNSNVTHSPPNDLVMKNQQWPTGDYIRTALVNAEEQEVAFRESKRSSRSETVNVRGAGPQEEFAAGDADQRCVLM